MVDTRIFVDSLETVKETLEKQDSIFKGEYIIHDIIFMSKDPEQTLDKTFLRLRLVNKNIWDEKAVIVVIKNTELKEIGKESIIPTREEFDNESDAREFIERNYSNTFEYTFEFDRTGWQYDLGKDQVDLEDIEGHYSIEFKSETEDGLKKLLETFEINPSKTIKGPSVVTIKDLLKK